MKYPANIYFNTAIQTTIKELERQIEYCGQLCGKESKQSEKNKEYFFTRSEEYKETIEELKQLIGKD